MTESQAWAKISKLFDGPETPDTDDGLCFAFYKVAKGHWEKRSRTSGIVFPLRRWAGLRDGQIYFFPVTDAHRAERSQIAALFAAMSDEERDEVLWEAPVDD